MIRTTCRGTQSLLAACVVLPALLQFLNGLHDLSLSRAWVITTITALIGRGQAITLAGRG
jgi:hypothetical protein